MSQCSLNTFQMVKCVKRKKKAFIKNVECMNAISCKCTVGLISFILLQSYYDSHALGYRLCLKAYEGVSHE